MMDLTSSRNPKTLFRRKGIFAIQELSREMAEERCTMWGNARSDDVDVDDDVGSA